MTVHRRHVWTLDDAVRDSGVVIANAGAGLPRRLTHAIDYSERVLALNPSGYWRMNASSGRANNLSPFPDLSINNHPLTPTSGTNTLPVVPGHGRDGDVGNGARLTSGYATAAARYVEHDFTINQPFSFAFWLNLYGLWDGSFLGTKRTDLSNEIGWGLDLYYYMYFYMVIRVYQASNVGVFLRPLSMYQGWDLHGGRMRLITVTYDGGDPNLAASWRLYVDDANWLLYTSAGNLTASPVSPLPFSLGSPQGANGIEIYVQDFALWNNHRLTETEIGELLSAHARKARFVRVFDLAATVKAVELPGDTLRDTTIAFNGQRAYLSVDGGVTRTEVEPGASLAYPVTPGQTLTMDVEQLHPVGRRLPFVADALGGGPAISYEEADPITNVLSIDSTDGQIDLAFSGPIGTVPVPTSDAQPAVQITGVTKPTESSLRLTNTPGEVEVQPAGMRLNAGGYNVNAYVRCGYTGGSGTRYFFGGQFKTVIEELTYETED